MAYQVSDIFIGSFPRTQDFGARAAIYQARYGLAGHNGIDWGTPLMTPIIAAAGGFVSEAGFDAGGYGNYLKIVHGDYLTIYAHLNDLVIKKGDRVITGQLLGHSGSTGFSDGPHLHFGIAPCDANGVKTETGNGYSGYIDPRGGRVNWTITNPTAPINTSTADKPPVQVPFDTYPKIITKSTNYDSIATFAIGNGINEYLTREGVSILDMQNNAADNEGGKKVVSWIGQLIEDVQDAKARTTTDITGTVANLPIEERTNLLNTIVEAIKRFTFK